MIDLIRCSEPWLISAEALDYLASRVSAYDPSKEFKAKRPNPLLTVQNGVGIVKVEGTLMRRPADWEKFFMDATDTEEVEAAVAEAAERNDVTSILLDIDSPGGTVNGIPELADAVRDASERKFVHAWTGGMMASAAYWIGSQADAIYASPSAKVGSIGVLVPFLDRSEQLKKAGLRMEVFASGKFKGAGTPGTSLTEAQRELIQDNVQEIFEDFKAAVLSRGRQVPVEAMEGQTFSARTAQKYGLTSIAKSRDALMKRIGALNSSGPKVDTVSRFIPSARMKTVEEQLAEAIQKLEAVESLRESVQNLENGRKQDADKVEQFLATITNLETQLAELKKQNDELAKKGDEIEKKIALRAAQIAAEGGAPVPAQVTPSAEDSKPLTAAEAWNKQFVKA